MPRHFLAMALVVLATRLQAKAADIRYLDGHLEPVRAVAFSPDQEYLVSVGDDSRVVIRPTSDLSQAKTRQPRPGGLRCLAFTSDGQHVLASGNLADFSRATEIDGILKINLAGQEQHFIELPVYGTVLRMALTQGDRRVAYLCANRQLLDFDIERKAIVARHPFFGHFIGATAISPDARHFAAMTQDERDGVSAEPCKLTVMQADGAVTASHEFANSREYFGSQPCFAADGLLILCLSTGSLVRWEWNPTATQWDRLGEALPIPQGRFSAIAWDETRKSIWLAREESLIQIALDGAKVKDEIRLHPGEQKGNIAATPILCLAPQPQRIVAGLWDGRIAVVPLPGE